MPLPTFLVIGAAKSGTTSLHRYLAGHPDVFMSSVKEPNFFSFEGGVPPFRGFADDGTHTVRDLRAYEACRYRDSVVDLAAYQALFRKARRSRCVGESSPTYLYVAGAAERIRRLLPAARLVAILRNPVDRAFSQYLHLKRDGHEPLGFAEALRAEEARIRQGWSPTYHYRSRGFYARQLRPYFDRFDPSAMRIVLYEDLCADAAAAVQGIFRFLGVDPSHRPDVAERHNEGSREVRPRSERLRRLLPYRALAGFARRSLPEGPGRRLRNALVAAGVLEGHAPVRPELPAEIRGQLVEAYDSDIAQLEAWIGRDLAAWRAR